MIYWVISQRSWVSMRKKCNPLPVPEWQIPLKRAVSLLTNVICIQITVNQRDAKIISSMWSSNFMINDVLLVRWYETTAATLIYIIRHCYRQILCDTANIMWHNIAISKLDWKLHFQMQPILFKHICVYALKWAKANQFQSINAI